MYQVLEYTIEAEVDVLDVLELHLIDYVWHRVRCYFPPDSRIRSRISSREGGRAFSAAMGSTIVSHSRHLS